MNARIRFAVLALAALAASATVGAQGVPPMAIAMATEPVAATPASVQDFRPTDRAASDLQPCRTATFTELGHGHGDVASAGYAPAHCSRHEPRADAGDGSGF